MADESPGPKKRDAWDRLEIIAKIVGGVSIPVVGLLLTYALHVQTESSQRAQLYASITTGREKADSDVRSQMFSRLLDRYLVGPGDSKGGLEEFHERVMFLDLLRANFEEYFNARPLFTRLYEQIRARESSARGAEKPAWSALKGDLVEIAKDTTSRQVARLIRAGHLTEDIVVPVASAASSQPPVSLRIALYPTRGLHGLTDIFKPSDEDWTVAPAQPGSQALGGEKKRYSITIRVKELLESAAKVSVLLYRDVYDGDRLDAARSLPDLRPIEFEVSYFSTPYMDNTRLFDGSRFSVIYVGCIDEANPPDQTCRFPLSPTAQPKAQFKVVVFDEAFLSQRDRPYIDQILEKIGSAPAR
jgi:hypothetical protein